MQRITTLLLGLMLCLALAGCGADKPYDLSGTKQVEIHAYESDATEPYAKVIVTGEDDVAVLVGHIESLSLKKMDKVDPSVAGYDLYFRDSSGEQIVKLSLPYGPTPWVICGADAYAVSEGSVDVKLLDTLVETSVSSGEQLEVVEHPEPIQPLFFESPPGLSVQHNGLSIQAMRGTSSWHYNNPDGTTTGIETDSMHPLNAKEYMPVLPAVDGKLLLSFDTVPDELTIKAWPVSEWGNEDAIDDAINVTVTENQIATLEGGHIYEVFAKWTRFDRFGGSAYYSFCTSPLGVSLTAKDITPTGLTLVCTQSGGKPTGELQTGSPFWIERWADGYWESVPRDLEEIIWTAIAWMIPKNGSVEWTVSWENIYGALPAGRYRIGKEIMDFRGPGDFDKYNQYAVFSVE